MIDRSPAPGKPAAVKTLNGRPVPCKPNASGDPGNLPRAIAGKVMGRDRPAALPMPATRDVFALSKPNVLERWNEVGAGVRAVAVGDNVIQMFGDIGEDYWSDTGITAKKVSAQLRAIGTRQRFRT